LLKKHRKNPRLVDEGAGLGVIEKYSKQYQTEVKELAPLINTVAKYIPSRRKRKLHISLFGYSRSLDGISLPRAISYTAALYSIGYPPELLALRALDDTDLDTLRRIHINFEDTLSTALSYYNPRSKQLTGVEIGPQIEALDIDYETNQDHKTYTDGVIDCIRKNQMEQVDRLCLQAAHVRKFLG
jgi:phosphoenolpyruvate carboxylase